MPDGSPLDGLDKNEIRLRYYHRNAAKINPDRNRIRRLRNSWNARRPRFKAPPWRPPDPSHAGSKKYVKQMQEVQSGMG